MYFFFVLLILFTVGKKIIGLATQLQLDCNFDLQLSCNLDLQPSCNLDLLLGCNMDLQLSYYLQLGGNVKT